MLKILLYSFASPFIVVAKMAVWLERNFLSSHLKSEKPKNKWVGQVRLWQEQATFEAHQNRELQYSHRKEIDELNSKHQEKLAAMRREHERNRL
jgi:hypothetical protein